MQFKLYLYLLFFFLLARNILGQRRKRSSSGTAEQVLFLAKAQVLDCQHWCNLGSLILSKAVFIQSFPLFLFLSPPQIVYNLNSAHQNFSFLQWAVTVSKWQPIFTVLFIISCFLKIQKRFTKVSGVGGLNCHLYRVSLSFFQVEVEKWRVLVFMLI